MVTTRLSVPSCAVASFYIIAMQILLKKKRIQTWLVVQTIVLSTIEFWKPSHERYAV